MASNRAQIITAVNQLIRTARKIEQVFDEFRTDVAAFDDEFTADIVQRIDACDITITGILEEVEDELVQVQTMRSSKKSSRTTKIDSSDQDRPSTEGSRIVSRSYVRSSKKDSGTKFEVRSAEDSGPSIGDAFSDAREILHSEFKPVRRSSTSNQFRIQFPKPEGGGEDRTLIVELDDGEIVTRAHGGERALNRSKTNAEFKTYLRDINKRWRTDN